MVKIGSFKSGSYLLFSMQDQAEQSTGYTPSIEIPRGVIDFLKPRGNYMPQQRGRAGNALRFNDIAGEDAEDIAKLVLFI